MTGPNEYSEDKSLISYRFGEHSKRFDQIDARLARMEEKLAEVHLDFTSQKRAWKTLLAAASFVGSAVSALVGWFMHAWTAR